MTSLFQVPQNARENGPGRSSMLTFFNFPAMTAVNDIVLIHYEDKPLVFARVEEILADHKPGWYHVRLLMLQVPVQLVTWILRDAYIEGEPFTMNGKRMRLERIQAPAPVEAETPPESPPRSEKKTTTAKVVNLADLKKK
jgi:hypothetical protein